MTRTRCGSCEPVPRGSPSRQLRSPRGLPSAGDRGDCPPDVTNRQPSIVGSSLMDLRNTKERANDGARNRRRVVAVIGSGTTAARHADEVGCLIATMGFDLLTGAGRGVMEAVSRAFFE